MGVVVWFGLGFWALQLVAVRQPLPSASNVTARLHPPVVPFWRFQRGAGLKDLPRTLCRPFSAKMDAKATSFRTDLSGSRDVK